MKIKSLLLTALLATLLAGCSAPQNIAYLQDAEQLSAQVLQAAAKHNEPTIMPGDLLHINVSATNADVVKPFNKSGYIAAQGNATLNNSDNSIYYYLVDNNGCIEYPLLGQLKIGGMTQSMAQNYIASLIYPRYITEKPGVEVRFQNFHVFTMGEVNTPGMIKASNGRINILEAIAQSGDLTIQGRRDNVMLIHTNADGSRQVNRINLNDKNLLVSPLFNLQQNDIIYVVPNSSKQRSSYSIPPQWTLGVGALGTAISVATLVITLINKK